jgi:MOSC domain-containing protein YiiM
METGRLIGIARRPARRARMETLDSGQIAVGRGLDGDHKGVKFPKRAITILAQEDWEAALAGLHDLAGPVLLHWTVRRANLLVEGLRLPRVAGARIRVGPVLLEVTYQTVPCKRMDDAYPGLMKALSPQWRGGVSCRIIDNGTVALGDEVAVVSSPPELEIRLPG